MSTHRYDSGVGWDTAPNDPIYPCCDLPSSAPIHDVICPRCSGRRTARHDCWVYGGGAS